MVLNLMFGANERYTVALLTGSRPFEGYLVGGCILHDGERAEPGSIALDLGHGLGAIAPSVGWLPIEVAQVRGHGLGVDVRRSRRAAARSRARSVAMSR